MRPVIFTFATETQNEICATNASAASGTTLVLNGGLSNYPSINSAGYIPQVNLTGIARPVQVFSTGNISTSTFSFTGIDINGYAVSTSFAGPTGTAGIAQSTTEFHQVLTASVGNTAATSSFTIGFGASGSTNAVVIDGFANPITITYALVKAAGTAGPVTFQHTFDPVFTATAPTWSTVTFGTGVSLASQTTPTSVTVPETPYAVRAICVATAAATGALQINIIQSGS
jgi:hypothetical protein